MLVVFYSIITFTLNFYEAIFYFNDWKRTMNKNKRLIPTTLFHTFITYPISLILTDMYSFNNIITMDEYHIEILKFLIGINIFDFFTFSMHLIQHKYFYKFHHTHHELREPCIFFAYYIDMVDLVLTVFPFIIIPRLLNFSKLGVYLLICFNILFGSLAHHIYNFNGNNQFMFHNYHHFSPKHNFGTGYPFVLINWDKLFGTYKYQTEL